MVAFLYSLTRKEVQLNPHKCLMKDHGLVLLGDGGNKVVFFFVVVV